MSSPFGVFRKHQKILLVVMVGLSMLSFVIFDAVQNVSDVGQMPPTLIVLTVAALVGSVAWVVGINNEKSSEYGSMGLIAGVAIGLLFVMQSRRTDAVTVGEFEMTQNELNTLVNSRYLANRFIAAAIQKTTPDDEEQNRMLNFRIRSRQFGFGFPEEQVDRDVIIGELLRREAAKIGMDLPESAVHSYIKESTDNRMTSEKFRDIRNELNASEADVVESIRQELLARQAANVLYSRVDLPPAVKWEFSQRLQVRQSATTAAVPVSAFIDESAEPPPAELEQLFTTYRENAPGFTRNRKVDEGRPGFLQPDRISLAYVTPDYQAYEAQVTVTDEEIEARYQRDYVEPAKAPAEGGLLPEGPLFPGGPTIPKLDGPALPATDSAVPSVPADPETASEASDTPGTDEDPASPEVSAPETPTEEPTPSSNASDGDESSCDDEPAPDAATDEAETDEEPAAASDSPAAETPATPATGENDAPADAAPEKPAAGDEPDTDSAAPAIPDAPETPPPTPESDIPPLDDNLKLEIREQLLAEKTAQAIELAMSEAVEKIRNEIGRDVHLPPDSPQKLTPAEGTKQVQDYAAAHDFSYVESDLLSYEELLQSDDYPVAQFQLAGGSPMQTRTVADELFSTSPADTFRPRQVEDRDAGGRVRDRAIYWKLEHQPAYIPDNMSEERVREQVVQTWRELQAREKAEERARELAEQVRKSNQPMLETLADATVTGGEDSTLLNIMQTGQFSWMRQTIVPAMTLQGFDFAPVRSTIQGIEQVGDDFMQIVFRELDEGDVGVAPSLDRSVYYVVEIDSRIPADDEQHETVRNNYLAGREDAALDRLGGELLNREIPNWGDELLRKYDVQFAMPDEPES